jgi:hypothetical protein
VTWRVREVRSLPLAVARRGERGGVLFKLLVFLLVIAALAGLAWMLLLPVVFTKRIRATSGFETSVASLVVNPLSGKVEVKGLVVTNPPTFPVGEFVQLREFRADVRTRSLFSEQLVIDTMVVDVERVTLVKRGDGVTNAQAFERNLAESRERKPRPPAAKERTFLVRELRLRVDELVVADHSGRRPSERRFPVAIRQDYEDVVSMEQLLSPAALRPLAPVAAALSGFVPGDLGAAIDEAARSGADKLKEAGRKTTDAVRGFFDALEESRKP